MKITVKNKEYDSGKLVRSKYKAYSELRDKILSKQEDGKSYNEEDLDNMVSVLVKIFDNQFTEDDINDDMDVADIIFNFTSIDFSIMEKLDKKVEKVNEAFTKGKKQIYMIYLFLAKEHLILIVENTRSLQEY